MIEKYPGLIEVLNGKDDIVYLCGAGVSMALGKHNVSWGEWLRRGEEYVEGDELGYDGAIDLIGKAGVLFKALKKSGVYDRFMNETIGSLQLENIRLGRCFGNIARAGDVVMTTNYDVLLEQATGQESITYQEQAEMLGILKGKSSKKVFHVHGIYKKGCDNIIADPQQYSSILENRGAQFIQNLISTNPLIILGCGATVDDPNMSGFLSFVSKYLKTDFPYLYLHCAKEDVSWLPETLTPICYGEDYEDLTFFLEELSLYRLRYRSDVSKIASLVPYSNREKSKHAYGRMHFSNKYLDFVGRESELVRLEEFRKTDKHISWWLLTGESGIGKSRLALQWIETMPCDWYGFFLRIKTSWLSSFVPFCNTVVAIDYIVGQEQDCAEHITELLDIFENSRFKLRILLIERHCKPSEFGWMNTLEKCFQRADLVRFKDALYDGVDFVKPLALKGLEESREREIIERYTIQYLANYPDLASHSCDDDNQAMADRIFSDYKQNIPQECRRPLFIAIFVEVWIYKNGNIPVLETIYSLLEAYIEKEESLWRIRLRGDEKVLYAYQKMLALTCAIDYTEISDTTDTGYYEEYFTKLTDFIHSEKRAGKPVSTESLFISEERDEEGNKILCLHPVYPGVIKEFIVDYYIDYDEVRKFTKVARRISLSTLPLFISNALDDFPENEVFLGMLTTEPDEYSDYFEYWVSLFINLRLVEDIEKIVYELLNAETFSSYKIFELHLWRGIAVVLAERSDYDQLYDTGLKFYQYIQNNSQELAVIEYMTEIFEAFCVQFHNLHKVDQLEVLVAQYDKCLELFPDDGVLFTWSADIHSKLIVLKLLQGYTFDNVLKDWNMLMKIYERFPKDDDIIAAVAFAADQWSEDCFVKEDFGWEARIIGEPLFGIYMQYPHPETAAHASRIFASELSYHISVCHKEDRQRDEVFVQECRDRITKCYSDYPDNRSVVISYAAMMNDVILDNSKKRIMAKKSEIEAYERWIKMFPEEPECLELLDYYYTAISIYIGDLYNRGYFDSVKSYLRKMKSIESRLDRHSEFRKEQKMSRLFERMFGIYLK